MTTLPRLALWALIGLVVFAGTAYAQDHQITYFRHNRAGAVTLSFDDGYLSQLDNAVPLLNARDLKATFFVMTAATEVSWDQWRQLAAQGHEIASHSVTHPDFTTLTDTALRFELSESQRVINENIPTRACLTIAYPYTNNNAHVRDITSEYYISARGGWAGDEGGNFNFYTDVDQFWPWPEDVQFGQFRAVDYYNTAGDGTPYFVPVSTLDVKLDYAVSLHAWYVMYLHTIPDDAASINYLATLLDDIMARNLWMATYVDVSQYMRERMASTISVVSSDASAIRLNLANSLD
jgi:peptidoglycan/xylan/chitin deacetylase (PgdA/CDA1 family)